MEENGYFSFVCSVTSIFAQLHPVHQHKHLPRSPTEVVANISETDSSREVPPS